MNYQNYMSVCSEKTLHSSNKGFFMQFVDNVSECAGKDWILNIFGTLKSDKERIRRIYEDDAVKENICNTLGCVQEIYRKKSADIALARRKEAQAERNKLKSLALYSQSVLRSPANGIDKLVDDGKSLSCSLWGRSELLMMLNEYSYALNDLQLALKEGVPSHFKSIAFWRMAICYKARNEAEKAKVSFNVARKLLADDPKNLKMLEEDVKKDFCETKQNIRKHLPSIPGSKNKILLNACKKLGVKESKHLGRFVVAKETIKTGETLVVEEPYVSCLLPEYLEHTAIIASNGLYFIQKSQLNKILFFYYNRLVAPVGCPDCSSVAFCKIQCREAAVSTYHKYECKFLDLLIGSGMSILSHAALRMVTQNSLKNCLEIYKDRTKTKAYSLCVNATQRKADDFLQRTIMAAFLLRCLQKGGYFGNFEDHVLPTEEELCVGELLLFHLQMLQFNAHEIYETCHGSDHRFRSAKATYIGIALYPTVSLFNHDCYPAVIRYFVGKQIVINAARPFGVGETVSENYGPMFTRKLLVERQKILAGRYWFKCQCLACTLNWPSFDSGLDQISKRIRCPDKTCDYIFTLPVSSEKIKCPRCKNNVSLQENISTLKRCESLFEQAFEFMDEELPEKGIQVLCEIINDFHRVSCPPHKEIHLAQEMLRALLADSGNVHQMSELERK